MSKRQILFLTSLLIIGLLIWVTPAILRAIPDRYVVRWVPQPLQHLALPETNAAILPTVAVLVDVNSLLQPTSPASPPPTFTPVGSPPTLTPIVVAQASLPTSPIATPTPTATPAPSPTPIPIPPAARLDNVSHIFQDWNNCGPATLAMTLSYFDLHLTQSDTASVLKPNPEDRNVSPYEMVDYVNNFTPLTAVYRTNGTQDVLRGLIGHGVPVIVEIGIEPPGEYRWLGWYGHYLLIVAYDDAQEQYWVYDSWFGTSETPLTNAHRNGRVLSYADVGTYWPHFNRNYIAIYEPQQAQLVADLIGADMDDATMWQHSQEKAQADASADPENAFFWFNLGTSHNALGNYEEAAAAFDQARAIGLPWRMLWYQFGPYEAYYQIGRYEDIILLADVTLQDRPYFEESFYYKGLALAALGQQAEAQQNLEKAAQFNPNYQPAVDALNQSTNGG